MIKNAHYTGASIFLGRGGCSGRATGSARCLGTNQQKGEKLRFEHLDRSKNVREGDVVVMPDLLPAMCKMVDDADGFVVYNEKRITGRGPTYARQLGIPVVIDCPSIHSEIKPDDRITVDGTAQWVLQHD